MNYTFCDLLSSIVLFVVVIIAAYCDVRWRRIPNWLTYPAIGSGLMLHCACTGGRGCMSSVIGMMVGFSFLVIFYLFNAIGGGDVKLMAGVGALVGVESIVRIMFWSACIGAVTALIILLQAAYRMKKTKEELRGGSEMSSNHSNLFPRVSRQLTIPYGIAIAGGALFTLFLTYFGRSVI